MPKYAQIDLATGRCISVSYLSGEVVADDMKSLTDNDDVNPNDTLNTDGTWTPAPIVIPTPPGPTEEQKRITSLEQQLAQTNADLAAVLEMIIVP